MKFSSLLVSAFFALASGHYVVEEAQGRYEEQPQNDVRAHQEGPRHYADEEGRYEEQPRNHVRAHQEGPRHYADEEAQGRYEEPTEYYERSYETGPRHYADKEEESNNLRKNAPPRNHQAHVRTGHKAAKHQPTVEERSEEYDVIIVGAGAAGLSAAHVFEHDTEWTYKVLEAHVSEIGGRTRRSDVFGFGVDLGAEFMHTTAEIVNGPYDTGYELLKDMVKYDLDASVEDDYTIEEPRKVTLLPSEKKENYHNPPEFRWAGDMTWWNFITEYVAYDAVRENIVNGCAVNSIDSSGSGVVVKCANGSVYSADHVIVTVPIKILQQGKITFNPKLGAKKQTAIDNIKVANGFKIWLQFTKDWYPYYMMRDADHPNYEMTWKDANNPKAGYRVFWDEMYPYDPEDSTYNKFILGGLIYGSFAEEYEGKSPEEIKNMVLELVQGFSWFDGQFTGDWELENWSEEEFIQSAYTIYATKTDQETISTPLDDYKVLFAGEALYPEGWGYVHGAAYTGRKQAEDLIARF